MAVYSYKHIPENKTFSEALTHLSYFLDKKNVTKNTLNLYPELLELRDILYDLEANNAGGNTVPRFRLVLATSNAEKMRQMELYKEANPIWNYVLKSFFQLDSVDANCLPRPKGEAEFQEPTSSIGLVSRAKYYHYTKNFPAMRNGDNGFVCSSIISDDTGLEIQGLACHDANDGIEETKTLKMALACVENEQPASVDSPKLASPVEQYWAMLDEEQRKANASTCDKGNGIPFPGAVSKRLWRRTGAFLEGYETSLVELFEARLGERKETEHCKQFLELVKEIDTRIKWCWKEEQEDEKEIDVGVQHTLNNLIVLSLLILETKFVHDGNSYASLVLRTTLTGRDLSSADGRSVSVSAHLQSDNGADVNPSLLCTVYTRLAKEYLGMLGGAKEGKVKLDSAYFHLMKQLHGFSNLAVHPSYTSKDRVSTCMLGDYFHKNAVGGRTHEDIEDSFLAHYAPKNIALTRYMLRELTKFLHLASSNGV